jgi:NAD(P)-dependent dehydrogenase (short-subunit alcohol dehydrogenase family)
MLEVNVVGVFNCARAAVAPMLTRGRGAIVNVTSGAQTGQEWLGAYGASKGAVASLTYAWAAELVAGGVRVNAFSPRASGVMSEAIEPFLRASGHAFHAADLPPPEANVPVVLFLLSARANGVTGQVVRIDGGKLSLMSHPAIRLPVLERHSWTLESVAAAFDAVLGTRQLPTGVATYEHNTGAH